MTPTKEGDIYSVGIIMQEVVMRGLPFDHERRNDMDVKGDIDPILKIFKIER